MPRRLTTTGRTVTNEDALKLPLLYKGRRMLVIDNAGRHFSDSSDDYGIIVWDRLLGCEVGFCDNLDDGSIGGWVEHGMNQLTIGGADPKALAQDTRRVTDWTLKN
jgi:hypothetical protein